MEGFQELVQDIWNRPVSSALPMKRLHIKLARVAKGIKRWKKEKIGDTKLQLAIVKEVLQQLEAAQEHRLLTEQELDLCRRLKARSMGLAAIEKTRIRQRSRLTYIRCGDANTKFFHMRASARRRKNYIHCLHTEEGIAIAHDEKEKVIRDYFNNHIGSVVSRSTTINWQSLGYTPQNLSDLEMPFSQEEVQNTINSMPPDKAPGPDGFTGAFFKACWETISDDVMAAMNSLFSLNAQGFEWLNSACIVLLPKKAEALRVTDFRPISLIHSIAKIFSKLLANRLAPRLNSLVSNCQSAFIKRRSIHDNFLYVQGTVRKLHKQKTPALFMKLDIHKAFDTVNWGYLLETLQALGFGSRWREWISILFRTASSTALMNGRQGPSFTHARGVRQGDPLSPMLFILAMDPLQRLLDLATQQRILTPLPLTAAKWRTSMYADDAAIFINPIKEDVEAVNMILTAFGTFSGLHINLQKSTIHPIRCENVDLDHVLSPFTGSRGAFPCKYLGLQLHTRSLQKAHVQPLIERIGQRLPKWKGRWLNKAGRLTLVSSVLSSMPTYHLTVFPLAAWARRKIDKIRRSFLWKGEENTNGGHCLVNWPTVTRPKDLGGLGVPDLDRFGRALRLRWLWQEWVEESKPWIGSELPCSDGDRLLFNSSITITLGDGAKAHFWHHNWLQGEAPRYLAPNLFQLASRKNRTVQHELQNNNWIRSLRGRITSAVHIEEFISLWVRIQDVHLQQGVRDSIAWKWTPEGVYSTRSAYRIQFKGSFALLRSDLIWRAQVENKCKIFAWILLQDKILTAHNLQKRGWPYHEHCVLCNGPLETGLHLCLCCPFAKEVWSLVISWENLNLPEPRSQAQADPMHIKAWWEETARKVPATERRRLNGIVIYTFWNIWKERNRRIFNNTSETGLQVAARIKEDIEQRKRAFAHA
jgi:hypothetical protein